MVSFLLYLAFAPSFYPNTLFESSAACMQPEGLNCPFMHLWTKNLKIYALKA